MYSPITRLTYNENGQWFCARARAREREREREREVGGESLHLTFRQNKPMSVRVLLREREREREVGGGVFASNFPSK